MAIEYLDGERFRRAVVAGADWVCHRRDHLNRINVFPVADGDTGTNMALSLSATAGAIRALDERGLGRVAHEAAQASVLGAKGNSGVIMAHWFLGLDRAIAGRSRVRGPELAECLVGATDGVFAALDNPVEGTIITVMRAVSDNARASGGEAHDLGAWLDQLIGAAEEALARTPEQLPVLREAHVVDAGAQGYVDFLQGVSRAVRGLPTPRATERLELGAALERSHADIDELSERFCTEVVVRGRDFDDSRARRLFRPMGSSLLVACTSELLKLHIHTNHPDDVIQAAAGLGEVVERKVDDMLRQRDERESEALAPIVALDRQPDTVAVVCDSTADLPESVRREHGIEMVPLQVLFGDEVFRDQIDLDTEGFYRRLQTDPHHPTTSQPPPRAFVEALDRVREDRPVLVMTVSGAMSGTLKSAYAAVDLAPHSRVEVYDSGNVSLGFGMLALNAARLAEKGADLATVLGWLDRWREDTGLVFTLATLEYLRRGGRIGAASSLIGGMLGLRPILALDDGQVVPVAKAMGEKALLDKAMRAFEARVPPGSRIRVGLIEIAGDGMLDRLEGLLRDRYDIATLDRAAPTGVIGAHAGPGAWGMFFQRVRPDDPLDR